MDATTVIGASEAKAIFSELHGHEAAKLVSARGRSQEDIREVITRMKARRSVLNPPGKSKLRVKDLIEEGRT